MKKNLALIFLMMSLSACSTVEVPQKHTNTLGMANPASTYCIEQGGKLELKNEAGGQVGYCHFADGKVVEEWSFFRQNHHCLAEEAKKLIGQSHLSDEHIQHKTQSEILRKLQPNQPATADYRDNRITVVVDPTSQKILQASCG